MSVDVTFEAVRKSDFVPFASMWLGGNKTAHVVKAIEIEHRATQNGWVIDLGDWKNAIDHLIELEDSFYSGHYGEKAIQLIEGYQDQMAYFLKVGLY